MARRTVCVLIGDSDRWCPKGLEGTSKDLVDTGVRQRNGEPGRVPCGLSEREMCRMT